MSVTKLYILQEIKRTTQANGGTPLRKLQFESATGIKRYDWFGVYWARWSDAIREADCMQDHIQEVTTGRHSKPLRYDRARTAPIVRLV
jgi:hypothetical protein